MNHRPTTKRRWLIVQHINTRAPLSYRNMVIHSEHTTQGSARNTLALMGRKAAATHTIVEHTSTYRPLNPGEE